MHYQRVKKFGSPDGGNRKYSTPDAAIEGRSHWEGQCRIWTGHINAKGYPRFNVHGRLMLVYRYVWEHEHGPIPDGMEIDHICFNRACINISHLRLATRETNTRYRSGAQQNSKSGVRNVHYRHGKWVVRVKKNGKHYEFGTYNSVEEAIPVAEAARAELFGKYAI